MRAHIGGFVLHVLLLLVLFLAMIDSIFLFRGKIFWLEILIVAGLVVLAAVSAGKYNNTGSSRTLLFVYITSLINVIVLSIIVSEIFWPPLILAALGVLLSTRKTEHIGEIHRDVKVEELAPEPVTPEFLAGGSQPIVESRVLSETKPAKRRKVKNKTEGKKRKTKKK